MRSNENGFSLIELLVVLVIMAVGLSLIAPSIDKLLSQQEEMQEMRELRLLIKRAAVHAFRNHQDVRIEFEGKQITLVPEQYKAPIVIEQNTNGYKPPEREQTASRTIEDNRPEVLEVITFSHITFKQESLIAKKNGSLSRSSVIVWLGDKSREVSIDIAGVLNVH